MLRIARRQFLLSSAILAARPKARLTRVELVPVRATPRTVWLFVRLHTDAGVTGLGEASDAFGFAATTKADAAIMQQTLQNQFALLQGRSPLNAVEHFRQHVQPLDTLVARTAMSAIEQALWDLNGKLLDVPVHNLFGGKVRDTLPVYANINRATTPRTPQGFAATARRAVADGFRSVKLAPFDGFPKDPKAVPAFIDQGIDCLIAVREAVGPGVQVMVDCHSFFTVSQSIEVARRLESVNLAWYEEPVAPERTAETIQIKRAIKQPMAGGEILFGVKGFEPLCRDHAVDVIMPDVKHCGGLLELTHIAAMAETYKVGVAPHNPSGPVATAASVHICAGMKNFGILELQWGEVDWRSRLVKPTETFTNGNIAVPDTPGLGVELDETVLRAAPAL